MLILNHYVVDHDFIRYHLPSISRATVHRSTAGGNLASRNSAYGRVPVYKTLQIQT